MQFSDIVGIKALTWQRDSHRLFDYESKQHQKNTLEVSQSCHIIRNSHEVAITDEWPTTPALIESEHANENQEENQAYLARVTYKEDHVQISNETDDGLWLLVKSGDNFQKIE